MSYFILKIPEVSADNYFTRDAIFFVMLWVILVACVLVCLWGYKHAQTLVVIILGALGAYECMKHLDGQPHLIVKLLLFAIFMMMTVCLVYGATVLVQKVLDLFGLRKTLTRMLPVLTSVSGAGCAAVLVYTQIFAFWPVTVVLFLVLAVGGTVYQIQSRKKTPEFHTYADLIKLQMPTESVNEHD